VHEGTDVKLLPNADNGNEKRTRPDLACIAKQTEAFKKKKKKAHGVHRYALGVFYERV
jgi:hypothetical protein